MMQAIFRRYQLPTPPVTVALSSSSSILSFRRKKGLSFILVVLDDQM